MKYTLPIWFLLVSLFGFSQTSAIKFPTILQSGHNLKNFVPANWQIRDSISFNFKGNLRGYAMVIESLKPLDIKNDTICFSSEPFYPKLFIIVLKQPDGTLALSSIASKIFGQCNWGVQSTDPYDQIFIRGNTLGIEFSTGGTERDIISYYFRYQNNDWYLIGMDEFDYWAGHEGSYTADVNLITGIQESFNQPGIGKGKIEDYQKTNIGRKPLIKIEDVDYNYSPFLNNEN